MKKSLAFVFCCNALFSLAQSDAAYSNPIDDDTYLHPVDGMTPYALEKGEWFYAQSLQTLPAPGWAFIGLTERLTLQLDFTPLLGGIFFEPHYPIPSASMRYQIGKQKKILPALGLEVQFFHLWDTLKRFDVQDYTLYQRGTYFHLKTTYGYRFNAFHVDGSIGLDYANDTWWNKDGTMVSRPASKINPNFSFGMSWRASKWISYHLAFTYGSTLTYFENVPRKTQFNYGMRMAPFYKNRRRILRNMRIELVSINAWFPDIGAYSGIPLPIYPLFYWQWQRRKE